MTRGRAEPKSCNQGRLKNDAFVLAATLPLGFRFLLILITLKLEFLALLMTLSRGALGGKQILALGSAFACLNYNLRCCLVKET